MLDRLRSSLREATVIRKGDYDYFVHPIADGVPSVDPSLLEEVVAAIRRTANFDCDLILAPEAMAIHLAAPLSIMTRVPYTIVRKRPYGLPGEVRVDQSTGYSKGEMFLNGVSQGKKVVIVDDVLSTGGTLRSLVAALRGIGAEIVDIVVVVEKGSVKPALEAELGIVIKSLVRIDVADGRVIVRD